MLRIQQITTEGLELNACIVLFQEYANELNEDLCFQSFDKELENPLKKYGLPSGALLLAYWNNEPVGCVALTNITDAATSHQPNIPTTHISTTLRTCEMKRLYVQPAYRKFKIGEALVDAILLAAVDRDYQVMKLDTLKKLQSAIQLYLKKGFTITNAYYQNPLPNVVYMEKWMA